MRAHRVHRLPVVDEHGRLAGMIALADLVRAQQAEGSAPKRRKAAEELALTVAAIRQPREVPEPAAKAEPEDVVLEPQPRKQRATKKAAGKTTSAKKKTTTKRKATRRKATGRGRRA